MTASSPDGSGSAVSGSPASEGTGAPSRPTAMAGRPLSLPSPSPASAGAPGVSSLAQRLASGAEAGDGAAGGAGAGAGAELVNPDLGAEPAGGAPNSKPPYEEVLLNAVPPDSAPLPARPLRFSSRPAAMTVTRTSSPRASSMTAPKMMFASTAAELETS